MTHSLSKSLKALFAFAFIAGSLVGNDSSFSQSPSVTVKKSKQDDSSNARQFDFWVGQWDVFDAKGKQVGTNTIESVLKGRALHEQWQSASGSKGNSYNIYADGRWHQTWVDDGGTLLLLDGKYADGRMVLQGETKKNGKVIVNRISWELLDDGRVKQHWETSVDDGKTWSDAFVGFYQRKPTPKTGK